MDTSVKKKWQKTLSMIFYNPFCAATRLNGLIKWYTTLLAIAEQQMSSQLQHLYSPLYSIREKMLYIVNIKN